MKDKLLAVLLLATADAYAEDTALGFRYRLWANYPLDSDLKGDLGPGESSLVDGSALLGPMARVGRDHEYTLWFRSVGALMVTYWEQRRIDDEDVARTFLYDGVVFPESSKAATVIEYKHLMFVYDLPTEIQPVESLLIRPRFGYCLATARAEIFGPAIVEHTIRSKFPVFGAAVDLDLGEGTTGLELAVTGGLWNQAAVSVQFFELAATYWVRFARLKLGTGYRFAAASFKDRDDGFHLMRHATMGLLFTIAYEIPLS